MIRSLFILFLTVVISFPLSAQQPAQDDVGFVYRKEAVGGLILHTRGWGGHFRYGMQKSYEKKLSFGLDLINMRHSKEKKSYNTSYQDGKGYYYGKLNSVLIFRPFFGFRHVLFHKVRDQGVEVGFNWSVGPSLAFVKPVYLEILVQNDPFGYDVIEERYDADKHFVDNIYGRAPFGRGLDEMSIVPGGHAKFGLHFEYSPEEDGIKALEVGGALDVYPKNIELMANEDHKFYFFTLYLNIIFGRKYF